MSRLPVLASAVSRRLGRPAGFAVNPMWASPLQQPRRTRHYFKTSAPCSVNPRTCGVRTGLLASASSGKPAPFVCRYPLKRAGGPVIPSEGRDRASAPSFLIPGQAFTASIFVSRTIRTRCGSRTISYAHCPCRPSAFTASIQRRAATAFTPSLGSGRPLVSKIR